MKTNIKNYFTILFTAALAVCGNAAWAKNSASIGYLDWDAENKTMTNATCEAYTVVDENTSTFESGWYVVSDAVTNKTSGITVNGDAHLILVDAEADLVVTSAPQKAAIEVSVSSDKSVTNSLTIYGQQGGTGRLTARACDGDGKGYCGAGIGAPGTRYNGTSCGRITINGGIVVASCEKNGAGIGGGNGSDNKNPGFHLGEIDSGTITINGGQVTASCGYNGSGIGAGVNSRAGRIIINGGNVTAQGGLWGGPGIGAGRYARGGTVIINGGVISATGRGTMAVGDGGENLYYSSFFTEPTRVLFGADYRGGVLAGENSEHTVFITKEAYMEDHGAYFVKMPASALAITNVEGLVYTVTDGEKTVNPNVVDGVSYYATTNHATLTVGFSAADGFTIVKEAPENPKVVADVMDITYLPASDLPVVKSAVQVVLENIFDSEHSGTRVESVCENGVLKSHTVILGRNYGPLALSNDFGAVTIDLNGWTIKGANGVSGSETTAGGNGGPAIVISGNCGASMGMTTITVENKFDFSTDGVTFVPGDYCVVDLITGDVSEIKNVQSADFFNTDEYKTTKMAFRYVKAGKFQSVTSPQWGHNPPHLTNTVALSEYWVAVFPVSRAQYNAVLGGDTTDKTMLSNVPFDTFRGGTWTGWDGTHANIPAPGDGTFVAKLNAKIAAAGCTDRFDVSSEFQLERAMRAGTQTDYFFTEVTALETDVDDPSHGGKDMLEIKGDPAKSLSTYAWYAFNSELAEMKEVGAKAANAWGLYDVYGNGVQICLDYYDGKGSPKGEYLIDYVRPKATSTRITLGGGSGECAGHNSSVFRSDAYAHKAGDNSGFRLVRMSTFGFPSSSIPCGRGGGIVGGDGGNGSPAGRGSVAVTGAGVVNPSALVVRGKDGDSYGSAAWPWKVGPEGSEDSAQAYTNGNDELVIEGAGPVVKKPWLENKDGIAEIIITDPDTELPDDAFDGMGSDDDRIKIVLPDNWQGGLPDESGNWYSAKVEVEPWPLMIRNVRFQQRYPWNGLVDIYADVYGPETNGVALYVSANDGEEQLYVENYSGDREIDLMNGLKRVHLVWDAGADIGWNVIRSDNVTVCVSASDSSDVFAVSDPGRVDLRRPIIVEPGDNDTITYSSTEWGEQPFGTAVDIRFGRFGEEPYPVIFESLSGDGVMDFVYPEQTGRYEFSYDIEATRMANMYISARPLVLVVWYIGKDDPKSVYAYDRGDGEIYIMGSGYMKDFGECGPWGTDITGVTINPGVWNLGANAFKGCTKMTHAEMPDGLKVYGDGAFSGATGLETIRSDAWTPPEFMGDPFAGVTKEDVIVYVPGEVVENYENSVDWAPFWNRRQSDGDEFYFEVYSYEGVSCTVTVNGEVWFEGTEYYDEYIPYGSKVEVTATITEDRYLFDDGSKVKTFTWNFWNKSVGVREEIMPYGADWITLQLALNGTPPEDLRDALTYENADGTNIVALLRDIATGSQYDRTLAVTNTSVLNLAGHAICYGNGNASVIGVGQRLSVFDRHLMLRGWLKIADSVGGGQIMKNGGSVKKEEGALKAATLGDSVAGLYRQAGGIAVMAESVCIMEGGVISGCYGNEAGGVYNEGTFVLTGGEIIGNVSYYDYSCDGIVNLPGGELVITGGKVRDGVVNQVLPFKATVVVNSVTPILPVLAEPVIKISGGYFGSAVTLDRVWLVDGYEAVPSDEFVGYDKQVIETPSDIAQKRIDAMNEIEQKAGLPMTRSDEMGELVNKARDAIYGAYPAEKIETVLAEYLAKVANQYAKDNPGVPQTLTATGTLDLRTRRELPYGEDVVDGITYSDSNWGESTAGTVSIAQQNLETGKKMTVVEELTGSSEGTAVQLIGQDTTETGLGHKLFHVVRGTFLESFVTFVFSGFERGTPSNPWDAGEPDVIVSIDDDPNADPPPGKKLDIGGEGELEPNGQDVPWDDRREEITEIFVASGVVLKASSLAGYPNLQRIVFEDPDYRLPHEAMDNYQYTLDGNVWYVIGMTWPSDGVYVMQFNGRQKVTAFYDEEGVRCDSLSSAYFNGFDPILFSTVPKGLIDGFPQGTPVEPITDDNGDLQGWKVTLEEDLTGPVLLPDDLGWVVIDLNGHDIRGTDGYYDKKSEKNGNGTPAFMIESSSGDGDPLVLEFIDSKPDATPDVVGGKGLDGNPAGYGAVAIYAWEDIREGVKVIAGAGVTIKGGDAGAGLGAGVPAAEPGSYGEPEALVETIEGGKVEYGDDAEGDITAWAKCILDTMPPASWLKELPQGLSFVNGELWLWRRVGDKTGPATFDFNELPIDEIVEAGITSADIEFVPGVIEVDTIAAPIDFGFRFVSHDDTTLKSVSGKSIFEVVGGTTAASSVVWENLKFTCAEHSASDRWGGAIRMEGGAMQVVGCTFENCFADDYGGAIFAFGLERDSSVTGCRFENCFVDGMYGYGGAIYASSKVVGHAEPGSNVRFTVSGSTFSGNAAVNGGAICTMRDANVDDLINEQPIELVIGQTSFMENAAEYDGGAIFAEGPVTIVGTQRGGTVPVVIDPLPVKPVIVGAVRNTSFYRNIAGGSGGAIAMDCVVGDWFVPAKLSVGAGTSFTENMASNAYTYALGGAIAHLQPGGELEIFGARFQNNTAIATGFNAGLAYALGGAVYADSDATVSLEKTRFFGNWAVSENAYAYGGAAEFLVNDVVKVTACSFDDNCVAAPDYEEELGDYYGGALDFGTEVMATVRNSTFRGSNVEAVNAYGAQLTFTNCVVVGNGTRFVEGGVDIYSTDATVDVAWSAYGAYDLDGVTTGAFDDEANHNLPASTIDIYDPAVGAEPWLCPTGYVAAAALGLVQDATDIDSVPYGSRFWGYSMGAYECHTMRDMNVGIVITVDPEEFKWTGLPIEPHAPVKVFDTITGSNLVEGVDYTLDWSDNVDPTDRAVVTVIGTERDYIFSSFTNFWITAYYVDYYYDEEGVPRETTMFGELSHTNVTARIAPPPGYAYDPVSSMPTGTVRRYDGECPHLRNGQLTLVVRYFKDESGDDIPDVYQKKMHLKVVNGWWNEELNGADKTYWVTLYDEDGKWSTEGVGILGENPTNRAETVVFPTAGQRPFTDYSASGKWWYLFSAPEFMNIAEPAGLEVRSGSWPFVIFLYDRKNESEGGRTGRGGRGGTGGTSALEEYKLRVGLRITKFAFEDGTASGEAHASVVDESTGQTFLDELLRRTKVDVLASESLDGEWSVIGSPTTDGEGGWNAGEGSAAETPAQMFYKLQLR